jgi:2-polyprenyl-3-methyl-5-hydroxy-6-metoxy-1,4-benzoquinol methylase
LWSDRVQAAVLPTPPLDAARWRVGTRTRGDRPPPDQPLLSSAVRVVTVPHLRPAPPVRSFEPVGRSLRREILRHYYDSGLSLSSESGLRTLETNSSLAEVRAATIEHVLTRAQLVSVRGRALLDLGCGFGALALVFATRGAQVTALDPNSSRLTVGAGVAAEHGLDVDWVTGSMGATNLGDKSFDVVLMNNSFCYVVGRAQRRRALEDARRALRPGGVLVIRNPNRVRLLDQFTGLPLLGLLPPAAAAAISRGARRKRSRVRLLSSRAARRELRRAGFVEVVSVDSATRPGFAVPFAAYQHLLARRPIQ